MDGAQVLAGVLGFLGGIFTPDAIEKLLEVDLEKAGFSKNEARLVAGAMGALIGIAAASKK